MTISAALGIFFLGSGAGALVTAVAYSARIEDLRQKIGAKESARRSTRISSRVPIIISSLHSEIAFSEECEAIAISAHGCGVVLHHEPGIGTPVLITLISRGTTAKAKVAVSRPLMGTGSCLAGIEFDIPENFWQIEDPPADWHVATGSEGRGGAPKEVQRSQTLSQNQR